MKTKFFFCPVCGNVVVKVVDSGVVPRCCGTSMVELQPGFSDGVVEKHVPVYACLPGGKIRVEVGSKPHPMSPEHQIMFIALETENGLQMVWLNDDEPAVAEFCVCCDRPVAVFEYCNLHGLWVTPVDDCDQQ